MAARITNWAEGKLRHTQYGFRKARSTGDPIHLIRRAQDLIEEKEYQTLHLVFLDWEKAFDSVHRSKMLEDCEAMGMPCGTVSLLRSLLRCSSFRVRMNDDLSEWKTQERG
eukprot:9104034-Alexandrium_andersonii.AAC.1